MKINKLLLAIIIIAVFGLGIMVGRSLGNSQNTTPPTAIDPLPKNCTYNNKTYRSGEGFPSTDGCNSCSCNDGEVACTLMACEK